MFFFMQYGRKVHVYILYMTGIISLIGEVLYIFKHTRILVIYTYTWLFLMFLHENLFEVYSFKLLQNS
jgi:hypothetical protein